ncbi:MAG: hypothetical protein C0392_15880 [Syntrophus sp. (in: bacteria)]|nr:hypothetical protein [Syntrophus sp. (in: bacteria)]
MPLIQVAVVLVVVGIFLLLANRFIPMSGRIKSILVVVVVVIVVLWLMSMPGLVNSLSRIYVGR